MPTPRRAHLALVTLLLAVMLGLASFPASSAPAGHGGGQGAGQGGVPTRTFRVSLALNGEYINAVHFTDIDTQGYCPGTGQVLHASFSLNAQAKLKVKMDTEKSSHAKLDINDFADNDWTMTLLTVAQGDPCDSAHTVQVDCSGVTGQSSGLSPENFAYAQGDGRHHIIFGTELIGTPEAKVNNTDCHYSDASGYYPGPDFINFSNALLPYQSLAFGISLEKLARLDKGDSVSKNVKPLKGSIDADYDVATCNHAEYNVCSGYISQFTHKITIKRLS